MKKYILIIAFFSIWGFQGISQNSIVLNINHKLGDTDFEMNKVASNNLDQTFEATRLEYYISEITLTHDGGAETKIEDFWILADASNKTEVELGSYDITTVEKIKFFIGVDPENNHLDPATFASDHPLSPKNPSMHWGWTAGYRFIAYEGNGGANLNQKFELHGLGDENYAATIIELEATAENNVLNVNLDADYAIALQNIAVASGVVSHGATGAAKDCVSNFNRYVFSEASISSSTIEFAEVQNFSVYPNPVDNGQTTVRLDLSTEAYKYDLSIASVDGKSIQRIQGVRNNQVIDLSALTTGMYLVNLIKKGQVIISRKVMIK